MNSTTSHSDEQNEILFSFLTPTRKRPDLVARLFQSIVDTTAHLDRLEVILAVDGDDGASLAIEDDRLNVKKVILNERVTMGRLNNACFEAASGRYVMIMNDDVILRTKGWDDVVAEVYRNWSDDIGLVHVNDLLFEEKLCTFPILSRKACLAVGLCPEEYRRYKIDDHIYDIYNMLAHVGHRRIVYLPDVVFEHENHEQQHDGSNKHAFAAAANKVYVPKKGIIERDDETYIRRMDDRKEAALKLAAVIDREAQQREEKPAVEAYAARLSAITPDNPYGYRHSSFVTTVSRETSARPRVTVAVVTADLHGEHARRCIESVKKYTKNYDLIVLDNNRSRDFSHPREMNKVLRTAATDIVVLLDDDVFVTEGWLDGMMECLDERTAAVTPMHVDGDGNLTYTGMYLAGDGHGTHEHTREAPDRVRSVQCHCSACLLMDRRKIGHIRMDETYRKYFFDLVHSLEVWEAGYRCVLAPKVSVTHLGGATTVRGSENSDGLLVQDRSLFIETWVKTGRLDRLSKGPWQEDPYTRVLTEIPIQIDRVLFGAERADVPRLKKELSALLLACKGFPLFGQLMEVRVAHALLAAAEGGNDAVFGLCLNVLTLLKKSSGYVMNMKAIYRKLMDDGRIAHAERVASAAVMLDPADPYLWEILGANKFSRNDFEASRKAYERALDLKPDDPHTLVNLGKICMHQAAIEDAFAYFGQAARHDPNDAEAHVGLTVTAHHLKKPVFKTAFKRARELAPGHAALRELRNEMAFV